MELFYRPPSTWEPKMCVFIFFIILVKMVPRFGNSVGTFQEVVSTHCGLVTTKSGATLLG